MPRRSSFSRSNSSSRNTSSRTAPRPAPPTQSSMPQTQQKPGFMGSMMGTMFQGMAFGAGSEVAHQAIRGVTGGSGHQEVTQQAQAEPQQYQQPAQNNCQMQNNNFVECLKFNSNNIQMCQDYLTELKRCDGGMSK